MLVVRPSATVRQEHMHPEISIAVMVQLLENAHGKAAVGRRVKRRMEMPIERTPSGCFACVESRLELIEHVDRSVELLLGNSRNCAPDEIAFDLRAELEQFHYFLERHTRHDRAAVRVERDEPFG